MSQDTASATLIEDGRLLFQIAHAQEKRMLISCLKVLGHLPIHVLHLVQDVGTNKLSAAALLPTITSISSLTCLKITGNVLDSDLAVLTNIVQSHPTLEVLVL